LNPIVVRGLTVRYGRVRAVENVSFDVAPGAVYVLFGRIGAGKSSLVRCLLGRQKPTAGTCFLFGEPARKSRAPATGRVAVVSDGADVPFGPLQRGETGNVRLTLGSSAELLVFDDPTLGPDPAARRAILADLVRESAGRGTTVFLTTHDLDGVEGIATRIGLLKEGRLLLDDDLPRLNGRFRRIRYSNEITEDRTEFGTELDEFDAVRVRVRGWGIEAVVSDFDEEKFARFTAIEGVVRAEAEALSLEEILEAWAGVGAGSPGDTRGSTP
jgi:ABC-2 type transport system ATP-binding protein